MSGENQSLWHILLDAIKRKKEQRKQKSIFDQQHHHQRENQSERSFKSEFVFSNPPDPFVSVPNSLLEQIQVTEMKDTIRVKETSRHPFLLKFIGIPERDAHSRIETLVKMTLALERNPAYISTAIQQQQQSSDLFGYKFLKVPDHLISKRRKITATAKDHDDKDKDDGESCASSSHSGNKLKERKILHLEVHVFSAMNPGKIIKTCSICSRREKKLLSKYLTNHGVSVSNLDGREENFPIIMFHTPDLVKGNSSVSSKRASLASKSSFRNRSSRRRNDGKKQTSEDDVEKDDLEKDMEKDDKVKNTIEKDDIEKDDIEKDDIEKDDVEKDVIEKDDTNPIDKKPSRNRSKANESGDGNLTFSVPFRITCYCSHHGEKIGYKVAFVVKDFEGNVVGTGVSPTILIIDNHKKKTASLEVSSSRSPSCSSVASSGGPAMGLDFLEFVDDRVHEDRVAEKICGNDISSPSLADVIPSSRLKRKDLPLPFTCKVSKKQKNLSTKDPMIDDKQIGSSGLVYLQNLEPRISLTPGILDFPFLKGINEEDNFNDYEKGENHNDDKINVYDRSDVKGSDTINNPTMIDPNTCIYENSFFNIGQPSGLPKAAAGITSLIRVIPEKAGFNQEVVLLGGNFNQNNTKIFFGVVEACIKYFHSDSAITCIVPQLQQEKFDQDENLHEDDKLDEDDNLKDLKKIKKFNQQFSSIPVFVLNINGVLEADRLESLLNTLFNAGQYCEFFFDSSSSVDGGELFEGIYSINGINGNGNGSGNSSGNGSGNGNGSASNLEIAKDLAQAVRAGNAEFRNNILEVSLQHLGRHVFGFIEDPMSVAIRTLSSEHLVNSNFTEK